MSKHARPKKKHVVPALATMALTGTALSMTSPASADTVTVRSADFIAQLSATRANGTVTVGDNGIGVVTEAPAAPTSPSPDKAAEYWKAEMPLADAGEPTLVWKGTTAKPGKQLYVDLDGDASTGMAGNDGYKGADGILVGEMYVGTGGKPSWWMNNASTAAAKAAAPQHADGGNTPWQGTLDEWRTAFPNAKVVATGFSLGSGVGNASGIITKVTVGSTTYDFAGKDAPLPPVTPPAVPTTAPTGLKVDATTSSTVKLSWNALSGAGNYHVFRDGVEVGTTTGTSFTVGGLFHNKAASYTVAAGQGHTDAYGPKSAAVTGKTKTIPLAAPGGLKAVPSTTSMQVSANAVPGADHYLWYIDGVAHGSSDAPSYKVVGLKGKTSYKLSVKADTITTAPGAESVKITVKTK